VRGLLNESLALAAASSPTCGDARAMEPLSREPPDLVQITIPRWVYNRIAVLLIAAQGGAKVEDYVVAVLEGHMRRLNL